MVSDNPTSSAGHTDPANTEPPPPGPRFSRQTLGAWLVAAILLLTVLPLAQADLRFRRSADRSQRALVALQATREALFDERSELRSLTDDVERLEQDALQIGAQVPALGVDWPRVLARIYGYSPARIALGELTDIQNSSQLRGEAVDESAVLAYAADLESSRLFREVSIRELRPMAGASPAPTGTFTPVPDPGPAPSPTPPLPGDPYEVDDQFAVDIALSAPQLRNFFPQNDVDRVQILGKAGRSYRVYTRNLAPGVDTWILVEVGGQIWSNDDRVPGDLSSEVIFQIPPGVDRPIAVTVNNRGIYGPDTWYQLGIEEGIISLPATASPTPTLVPTATHTPDRRDAYEPDELWPPGIGLGEIQNRNFSPAGDLDRAILLAKAGRTYRVFTDRLTLGVDTLLTVRVGGVDYTNDDLAPGVLRSQVIFQAPLPYDIEAEITVSNRGLNGPNQWYSLQVEELVATPTATVPPATASPTATATPTQSPTPTPTPLLPLQDPYEPDEGEPKGILIGESQVRNFYPQGDLDTAFFFAEPGLFYQIETTDLAAGVDTILAVTGNNVSEVNDDWLPGSPGSRIVLQAPQGGNTRILITVSNRGLYGADRRYTLRVTEVSDNQSGGRQTPGWESVAAPARGARGSGLASLQSWPGHAAGSPQTEIREGMTVQFEIWIRLKRDPER